jgi:dCTP deaminase
MLIVGENLRSLCAQHGICPAASFDQTSLTLTLDNVIFVPKTSERPFSYPFDNAEDFFERRTLARTGTVLLTPMAAVLACSSESINMPAGYFGLLQTKGSLARLLVSAHASDGQVDPGYSGKITFELLSHAPFSVSLEVGSSIAQLFVFKCSSESAIYAGRYQGAMEPTLFKPTRR